MSHPAERLRRPSQEVQTLILDAARDLFQAKGFGGTTTKEIALRAGVSEPLLFSNFGSKAGLFEKAIAGPFDEFTESYVRSWQEMAADSTDQERIEGFVRGLMELTERNRGLLADAISPASEAGDGVRKAVLHGISQAFQRIHAISYGPHPWSFDPAAMLGAATGMVMSTVLLDEILFPLDGPRPDREILIAEVTRLMLYGLYNQPPASP